MLDMSDKKKERKNLELEIRVYDGRFPSSQGQEFFFFGHAGCVHRYQHAPVTGERMRYAQGVDNVGLGNAPYRYLLLALHCTTLYRVGQVKNMIQWY